MSSVIDNFSISLSDYYSGSSQPTETTQGSDSSVIAGDVNDDKSVNVYDAISLKRYLNDNSYTINTANSDMNSDESVNISDLTALIKKLLNK